MSRSLRAFSLPLPLAGALVAAAPAAAWLAVAPPAALAGTTVSAGAMATGYYCWVENPTVVEPLCLQPHTIGNTDYTTGYVDVIAPNPDPNNPIPVEYDVVYRSFFAFDFDSQAISQALAGGSSKLIAATLRTRNFDIKCGLNTPPPTQNCILDPVYPEVQAIQVHGVAASADDLVNGLASFDDLGQGTVFASKKFPTVLQPTSVSSYKLNAAGLAYVNTYVNALLADPNLDPLALSGRNTLEEGGSVESPIYVYGNSYNLPPSDQQVFLDLQFGPTNSAVPGPLPLFGAAAAWRWSRRLRLSVRRSH